MSASDDAREAAEIGYLKAEVDRWSERAEADRVGRVQAEAELAVALRVLREVPLLTQGDRCGAWQHDVIGPDGERTTGPVVCEAHEYEWPCPVIAVTALLERLAGADRG